MSEYLAIDNSFLCVGLVLYNIYRQVFSYRIARSVAITLNVLAS